MSKFQTTFFSLKLFGWWGWCLEMLICYKWFFATEAM